MSQTTKTGTGNRSTTKTVGKSTIRNPKSAQIREKMETILHTWGEEQPEKEQDEVTKLNPERERFSVPHASRDPRILKGMNEPGE